jgi:hypothetical protein
MRLLIKHLYFQGASEQFARVGWAFAAYSGQTPGL